jgi:alpha-glucan phosphorylase-like protein
MAIISKTNPVAYFCAEYGVQHELPLYAGGLGILAGDTVKEAGDQNFPLVAVGLFYRGGKVVQQIDAEGNQYESDMEVDPMACGLEHVYVPQEEQPLFVRVHMTTVDVWARVWKKRFGSTELYLLDTDTDQNEPSERGITKALYIGSEETLLKQQMLLGIGGIKLFEALEIHPALYHVNEGRPAFLYWQLIRQLMDKSGMGYIEAASTAKSMIVYTNHTLVRAGNQDYDTGLLKQYGSYYAEKMGITIDALLEPGIESATGKFSLTKFALSTSFRASAVSQPHFELSRSLWPEFDWKSITNGVHMPTWQDSAIAGSSLDNESLWDIHNQKKRELSDFVAKRTGYSYDPTHLVIVWARRIAGYKRLHVLFDDIEELKRILKHEQQPVHLLIAGKAHAYDSTAKQIIKDVIAYMQRELSGSALFVPNYDMEAAHYLTRGADVWVNTPIKAQEACGTSGMKAIANGVLQLTVEEGWAAEVDWRDVGWTLDADHVAETLYFRLKQDVIPAYYAKNAQGVPEEWVERMKRSILLAARYSTTRMLNEYQTMLYRL